MISTARICQSRFCWFRTNKVKETFNGRFTWYNVSVGQFDPYTPDGNLNHNSLWKKKVQVTALNASTEVKLLDMCPSCPYSGLDLSPAAFVAVGGRLDIGVVHESWHIE